MKTARMQRRLRDARATAGVSRGQVVELAHSVPGSDPTLDEELVRRIESTMAHPPVNGRALRSVCAALGVPLLHVLRDLDYWPPLQGTRPTIHDVVIDVCSAAGWTAKVDGAGRILLTPPEGDDG